MRLSSPKTTGARLDKSSRFTDWARRPLSDAQLQYALGDVTHLRPAYEALRRRVEETGRGAWIEEEISLLCDPALYRVEPAEAWRRLKPKRNEPRYMAVLQTIAAWREHEAMTPRLAAQSRRARRNIVTDRCPPAD